jgi:hypothetical protein
LFLNVEEVELPASVEESFQGGITGEDAGKSLVEFLGSNFFVVLNKLILSFIVLRAKHCIKNGSSESCVNA